MVVIILKGEKIIQHPPRLSLNWAIYEGAPFYTNWSKEFHNYLTKKIPKDLFHEKGLKSTQVLKTLQQQAVLK